MSSTATVNAQITLNGEPRAIASGARVSDLVAQLALDPRTVAIEHNFAILPRSAYGSTPIMNGDRIEIVGFIGGG